MRFVPRLYFVTVALSLVLASCSDDDLATPVAPAPEPQASLAASDGSAGDRGMIRPGASLATCIALAVAEGEQLEDNGTSGVETWRRVKDDVAGCHDLWRRSHRGS